MISYDLFINIQKYALAHAESSASHYQSRNQNTDMIFTNCFNGKVAEWSNYYSLLDAGYIVEKPPCMLIFSQANKSHDADLIILGKDKLVYDDPKHIHIKSVTLETFNKWGASFLIEKNNKLVNNPDANHYYSVMLQQQLTHYVFHKWICTLDVKYGAPKMNLPTKLAVYL